MSNSSINRVAAAIVRNDARIERNEKGATKEDLARLYKNLDVDFADKAAYFETNARAFASQKLSLEESQQVYGILKRWDKATLSERIVVTQIVSELLIKR